MLGSLIEVKLRFWSSLKLLYFLSCLFQGCINLIEVKPNTVGWIDTKELPGDRFSCHWRLIGEVGTRIVILFTYFNLGSIPTSFKCDNNLEVSAVL